MDHQACDHYENTCLEQSPIYIIISTLTNFFVSQYKTACSRLLDIVCKVSPHYTLVLQLEAESDTSTYSSFFVPL